MNGRKQEILLTDYADEHRYSFITVNGHRSSTIGHLSTIIAQHFFIRGKIPSCTPCNTASISVFIYSSL